MLKKKLHLSAHAPPATETTAKLRNTSMVGASTTALNDTTATAHPATG